jgi:hypothetical protein
MSTPDYTHEDLGNVMALEHVNIRIPDQAQATLFYIVGLGLTRDPYFNVGLENMWINVGYQQFHLPTGKPQVIPGHVGLVLPDLQALQQRLEAVQPRLADTQFSWSNAGDHVAVTSPWGNQYRCYAPDPRFGEMPLGLPYVEFLVGPGAAEGVALFYQEVFHAPSHLDTNGEVAARVEVGPNQWLRFRETGEARPSYDGHHIAIYIADFSSPYAFLKARELISEDVRNHQFRFQELIHPENGERVFSLEHEVRSLRHPQYRRPLVNRLL